VRQFPKKCISKTLQNGYVDSLIHGLELGKKLVMHQTLRVKESGWPVCGSLLMDVRPFLNREYHSDVLDRLNAVPRCGISYVSVAVLPSFWQTLMQTHFSLNTSISQYDGGTNRIALQINSLTTESNCHLLLWYVTSGDVAKYPTWLSLRYCL
jgi:hypothetical protein